MNIYCKFCGEPWDLDKLHNLKEHNGDAIPHREALEMFSKYGCNAFTTMRWRCYANPIEDRHVLKYIGNSQTKFRNPKWWMSPDNVMYMFKFFKELS